MDPDALLTNLRFAINNVLRGGEAEVEDIALMFDNLDHWLSNGGFIPAAWAGRDPRHLANA
jgi:hypothetical protein